MLPTFPSIVDRLRFVGRNRVYRQLFDVVRRHANGTIVDVGGGSLFARPADFGIDTDCWILVESDPDAVPAASDSAVHVVISDGRQLGIRTGRADVVLAIHVLEHTFDPWAMWTELVRITKPGGTLVVMVPQTANLHHVPNHFQNFTRFWLVEAARRSGCIEREYLALGGTWSTIASRLVLSLPTMLRLEGYTDPAVPRTWRARLLTPVSALMTVLLAMVSLALRPADLPEEANNHVFVVQTPAGADGGSPGSAE